jgi:hypothetical protein
MTNTVTITAATQTRTRTKGLYSTGPTVSHPCARTFALKTKSEDSDNRGTDERAAPGQCALALDVLYHDIDFTVV